MSTRGKEEIAREAADQIIMLPYLDRPKFCAEVLPIIQSAIEEAEQLGWEAGVECAQKYPVALIKSRAATTGEQRAEVFPGPQYIAGSPSRDEQDTKRLNWLEGRSIRLTSENSWTIITDEHDMNICEKSLRKAIDTALSQHESRAAQPLATRHGEQAVSLRQEWIVSIANQIVDTLEEENLTLNKSEWVGVVHQIIRESCEASLAAEREKREQAEKQLAEYNEAAVFYELNKQLAEARAVLEKIAFNDFENPNTIRLMAQGALAKMKDK